MAASLTLSVVAVCMVAVGLNVPGRPATGAGDAASQLTASGGHGKSKSGSGSRSKHKDGHVVKHDDDRGVIQG